MGKEKMMQEVKKVNTFNSALEIGSRIVALLHASYPESLDIQKIIRLDYLMIHSGDVGGPESLHPPIPHRSGELLIKHDLVRRGVHLMMSRGLVKQLSELDGFKYLAKDEAQTFVTSFKSSYYRDLQSRADWVISTYSNYSISKLDNLSRKFFGTLKSQIQMSEKSYGDSA